LVGQADVSKQCKERSRGLDELRKVGVKLFYWYIWITFQMYVRGYLDRKCLGQVALKLRGLGWCYWYICCTRAHVPLADLLRIRVSHGKENKKRGSTPAPNPPPFSFAILLGVSENHAFYPLKAADSIGILPLEIDCGKPPSAEDAALLVER
jgi:hypothetical protein